MGNGINIGMKFGTYFGTREDLSNKYRCEQKEDPYLRSNCGVSEGVSIYYDRSSGKQVAELSRGHRISFTGDVNSKGKPAEEFVENIGLKMGSYSFSAERKTPIDYSKNDSKKRPEFYTSSGEGSIDNTDKLMLNRFTKVETDTQYAIDKNHNGIVESGEIFNKK